MSRSADEFDRTVIIDIIKHELTEYQSLYSKLPTLEVKSIWINGSFGAGEADESSDVDMTIEIGVFEEDYEMDSLYVADKITGLSGPITTSLRPVLPGLPDVTVIPSEDVLTAANLDAPTARDHIKKTQQHGGYEKVFDMKSGTFETPFDE